MLYTSLETLAVTRHDAVLLLRLNRPEVLNAINPPMVDEISTVLDAVEADPSIRVLVVGGTGRAFSAGGDLKATDEFAKLDDGGFQNARFLARLSRTLQRFELIDRPVIGAINGIAFAGGMEIALCCDIVIAADDAKFADAHSRYGLLPGAGGGVRLGRKIGTNRAKYLMFTASAVSAQTMQEWGLVNEVVPAAELDDRALALAAEVAERSPVGLARMKRLVDDTLAQPIDVALRVEQDVCAAHNRTYDRNEGLAAFNQKRKPIFKGR